MKIAVTLLMLLLSMPVLAQTVTPAGNNSATAVGSGASGTPTLNFTVQPGQNRIVFITAAFERDHCTAASNIPGDCAAGHDPAPNGNFADPEFVASGGGNLQINFNIAGPGGSTTVTNPLVAPAGDLRFGNRTSDAILSATGYSQEAYYLAIYESQLRQIGCTTTAACSITITLPGIDQPNRGGDEALIAAQQFNNVSQRANGTGTSGIATGASQGTGIVRSLVNTGGTSECGSGSGANNALELSAGNWSVCPINTNYDGGQAPLAAGDGVLLFGYNGYAGTGPMDFLPSSGFTELMNPAVLNTNPVGGNYQTSTESDGFSTSFQFVNGTPLFNNIQLTSQNGTFGAGDQVIGGFMAGFTLTRASIDLGLTKTNTPGVNGNVDQATDTLALGSTTTYTVVVTNKNQYNYINDAILTDPATANLTKTAVTCSATAGSTCPTGPLTVAALESGGLTIPTIAPLGVLTFTITATVADTLPLGTTTVTNAATITPPAEYTDTLLTDNNATDTDLVLGQIIIIKDAQPNAPGVNFNFTAVGTGLSAFSLMDDGTPPGAGVANTKIFNVVAGNFTVTESAASGWTLSNVVCSAGGIPVTVPIIGGFTGVVNITTVAGQAVTCTFTNKRAPVIRLQKEVPNGRSGAGDQFKLDIRTGGAAGAIAATATTSGSGTSVTGEALLNPAIAGTAYTLTEAGAAGAALANYATTYSCTNATATSTTVLPPNGSGTTIPAITPAGGMTSPANSSTPTK